MSLSLSRWDMTKFSSINFGAVRASVMPFETGRVLPRWMEYAVAGSVGVGISMG